MKLLIIIFINNFYLDVALAGDIMNPFYLFIAIFMLVKKSVDLVFDGIAALFTMSNERPRDSSRGGILDASQVETYSDDEDKVKEKGDNQS